MDGFGINITNKPAFDAWYPVDKTAKSETLKRTDSYIVFRNQATVTRCRRAMNPRGAVTSAQVAEVIPSEAVAGRSMAGSLAADYFAAMAEKCRAVSMVTVPEGLMHHLEPSLVESWSIIGAVNKLQDTLDDLNDMLYTYNTEATYRILDKLSEKARVELRDSLIEVNTFIKAWTLERVRCVAVKKAYPMDESKVNVEDVQGGYDHLMALAKTAEGFKESVVRKSYRETVDWVVEESSKHKDRLSAAWEAFVAVTTERPAGLIEIGV